MHSGISDVNPNLKSASNSFELTTPEEVAEVATHFADVLMGREILMFYGNLGSGKTFFIRHLAKALGIREPVVSPTFTIMHEYHEGRFTFYHFDLYRLSSPDELWELGLPEILASDQAVIAFEWAEKFQTEWLPRPPISLFFEHIPTGRRLTISGLPQDIAQRLQL
ncbi:MAG: tRNA (adenosine(37)-N6)-threonylcarbamoyltransferase complex ATPase subunit type 1 TsaE [Lentisphaerae bacterium]|nr:MAG: tRNA (adenosine(37)-N6)-threonylcarbamoyltransferase complex ATPase subunit type 1 TsaE [Lentisphaerota bacterium]